MRGCHLGQPSDHVIKTVQAHGIPQEEHRPTFICLVNWTDQAAKNMKDSGKLAALSASGNARTTTVRAFAPKEFAKIVGDAPAF